MFAGGVAKNAAMVELVRAGFAGEVAGSRTATLRSTAQLLCASTAPPLMGIRVESPMAG